MGDEVTVNRMQQLFCFLLMFIC